MFLLDKNSSKIEYALRLAELGFHILPCQANSKNPKKGFRYGAGASRDPDEIRQWFADDPDMNYGVCPREKGVIIDLDVKPENGVDGRNTWLGILIEQDDAVHTLKVQSPSDGEHYYFTTDIEVGNAHNFGKGVGIDVRGAGGYVIGPGCTLKHGEYVVKDAHEIAQAPTWLVQKYLRQPGGRDDLSQDPLIPWDLPANIAKAEEFLETHAPAVEGLNGNDHTYETAQWLRDFGVSEAKALALMFSTGWNERCVPPWGAQELEQCIHNAYRYGQNRPGEKCNLLGMYMAELEQKAAEGTLTDEERETLGIDADGNVIVFDPPPTLVKLKTVDM